MLRYHVWIVDSLGYTYTFVRNFESTGPAQTTTSTSCLKTLEELSWQIWTVSKGIGSGYRTSHTPE